MVEIVALGTGIVLLITAILSLVIAHKRATRIEASVNEVHVLVNSRLQAVLDRVDQLTAVLLEHGVPVPPGRDDSE